MGLGVYLRGRWSGDGTLEKAQTFLDQHCADMFVDGSSWFEDAEGDEPRTLHAHVHPAAETLRLHETADGLVASATTSTVGPGYHAWICDVLGALGADIGVTWLPADDDGGDETGYFDHRDRTELERQFGDWLRTVAKMVLENMDDEKQPMHLLRAMHAPLPLVSCATTTPLGPRDVQWVRAVAADASAGRDLFSWWESGTGAEMKLGRALYRMWNELPWRAPLDDDEGVLLCDVLVDLEQAQAEAPHLAYPWREWHELLGWVDEMNDLTGLAHEVDDELAAHVGKEARATIGPLIGYRRHPMRVSIGRHWSIEVPGSFLLTEEEDGTWLAYDATRTARLTSFRHKSPDYVEPFEPPADPALALVLDTPPLRGHLDVRAPDDQTEEWVASGSISVPGFLAVLTFTWTKRSDRSWADATLATLRFQGA